ncbi:MAG TPA: hypothetical protein H9699_08580 [Candidatus Gemmiger stercoravium]|nr:hypothetical protein [Candidatus Gemmiger stercoravium]
MVKLTKQKWIAVLIAVCALVSLCATNTFALEKKEILVDQYLETFDNGSYAVVTVYQDANQMRNGTISGHKDYSYYDGGLAWNFTVYGTFTSNGKCTAASYGVTVHNNVWYCVSGRAWPDGNSASASGTMRRGTDNFVIYPSVTLYCSPNGSLS